LGLGKTSVQYILITLEHIECHNPSFDDRRLLFYSFIVQSFLLGKDSWNEGRLRDMLVEYYVVISYNGGQ